MGFVGWRDRSISKRQNTMKKQIAALFLTVSILFIAGCSALEQNPNTGLYAPSPQLTNAVNNVGAGLSAAAGVATTVNPALAPAAALVPPAYSEVSTLIFMLAAAYAQYKNNQNKKAAAALASSIITNPQAQQAALTAANQNGSTGAVAQHIANANSPV